MNSKLGYMNIEGLYSQDIKPKQQITCQKNQHKLETAGGSSNGRKNSDYKIVYKCINCNKLGFKEDFN